MPRNAIVVKETDTELVIKVSPPLIKADGLTISRWRIYYETERELIPAPGGGSNQTVFYYNIGIRPFYFVLYHSKCTCCCCWCLEWYEYYYSYLNFMVRTDRRSPTGFLVRCSPQTSPFFVVE